MRNILFICAFALLLATGCSKDKADVKGAVVRYDNLLAEGYKALNMGALAPAATEKRLSKAYFHMAALGEAGLKMDSRLKDISFSDIKLIPPDKAEAVTDEVWDYSYLDVGTGKRLFDNNVKYRLRYALEKQSGGWLVSDITVLKTEEARKTDFIFHRPVNARPGSK